MEDDSCSVAMLRDGDEIFLGVLMDEALFKIAGCDGTTIYIDWGVVCAAAQYADPEVKAIASILGATGYQQEQGLNRDETLQ